MGRKVHGAGGVAVVRQGHAAVVAHRARQDSADVRDHHTAAARVRQRDLAALQRRQQRHQRQHHEDPPRTSVRTHTTRAGRPRARIPRPGA